MGGEIRAIMDRQGKDTAEMRGEQAREWLVRLSSGTMSAEELQSLDSWTAADPRNRAAFLHERRTWQDLESLRDAFESAPQTAPAARSPGNWRWLPVAAAAALVWFAAPSVWLWARADASTAAGEIREVPLADGSRAVLDSESAIAVDYDDKARSVRLLKGRAWFAVRHGDARPFRVAAADGTVRDIATAFEVDDTSGRTRAGVTEGAIAMGGLVLHAGEQAQFGADGKATALAAIPAERIAGWRRGELLLREVPLESAIGALARYRRAPVFTMGDLSHEPPISGSFRADRPDEALDTLAAMRGLERLRLPGGVVVLRRPSR
ncbi:MAG: iron dicitrate transport regulator FecR [Novosphingobium pentaromativorans]|uniref:Iron dicitrate transport regulator FecR n=2 Tax=Novosphingobium TaxID=165696 RepID=A0A2W5NJ31_9SPHN|nr:MAG: iron dicitrate transport regulator FecR [Novosphingobium pentaromativorans]